MDFQDMAETAIAVLTRVGLFASVIHTPDNVRVTVGNNKLFGEAGHPVPETRVATRALAA